MTRSVLLTLFLVAAPVPKHLMRPADPAPDPVAPGFRWAYSGNVYEVLTVDGDFVRYHCLNNPLAVHCPLDGAIEPNQQSRWRTKIEAGIVPQAKPQE
jgi:hypothetical protein